VPTYGYVHEAALDREYAQDDSVPRGPTPVVCPECSAEFVSVAELSLHLGNEHPLTAPRLLIERRTVQGTLAIHRSIRPEDVNITDCEDLYLTVDGAERRRVGLDELRDALSVSGPTFLEIALENRRADGAIVSDIVRISILVPKSEELDIVDRYFGEFLAVDEIDRKQIDAFAEATRDVSTVGSYVSALHQYCVAILTKDGADGIGDTVAFSEYRSKLQRSLTVLSDFDDRPVARVVNGFARFSLNDFSLSALSSDEESLDRCCAALRELCEESEAVPGSYVGSEAGRCPADRATGQILASWDRPDQRDSLVALAADPRVNPDDAAKASALALRLDETAEDAPGLAARLVNSPYFGSWAAGIVDNGQRRG